MMDEGCNNEPLPVEMLVCVKCRAGEQAVSEGEVRRSGEVLFDALSKAEVARGVHVRPVECLQNCEAGCTVALRGPERWTYIYGGFDPRRGVDVLLEGAALYHASTNGLIPWRARPEHFKRNCVARVPPLTSALRDTQTHDAPARDTQTQDIEAQRNKGADT